MKNIEDRLVDRGYKQVYDHNIWTDPNAFFGHLNTKVFVKRVPEGYVVQISTDGSAGTEDSEVNVTIDFKEFGMAWFTLHQHAAEPDKLIDAVERFSACEYKERRINKNKTK